MVARRVKPGSNFGVVKGSMDKVYERLAASDGGHFGPCKSQAFLHEQVDHEVVGVVEKCRVLVSCPGNLSLDSLSQG